MSNLHKRYDRAMLRKVSLSLFFLLPGCATTQAQESTHVLEYQCGDLAVIGRIITVGERIIYSSDDLPNWYSEYDLQIKIKRIIRGKSKERTISTSVISHAQIRDDKNFLVILHPNDISGYSLKNVSLWESRPKLKEPCVSGT